MTDLLITGVAAGPGNPITDGDAPGVGCTGHLNGPAAQRPAMKLNDRSRRRPLVQALRRRRSLQAGLVQLLYVGVAIAAGLVVPTLDIGAQIHSSDAIALIAGVTAGLLALTVIVFALLFLVVQFAATSQWPRLNLFRDNPLVWHTLGLIVGVLVYAATSAVVSASNDTTTVLVPISVLALILLVLAVTGDCKLDAFRSVQLSPVLDDISTRTRAVIDGLYPAPYPGPATPPPPAPPRVVQIRWPGPPRTLRQIDLPDLIEQAQQTDTVIRLRIMPGDLVRENAVVFEIWDPAEAPDPEKLLRCLEVGIDRNLTQDPLLGFRLLNDIALRALSAAVNDPATAVQALDCIEGLLLTLVVRDLAIEVITDNTDTTRVLLDDPDWETFLTAGADEIACLPVHPMVIRRLRTLLEQVLAAAPDARRSSLQNRITALDATTVRPATSH